VTKDILPQRSEQVARSFDLARLPATELIEGYRARRFTPVDVIDDVIGALEATDALCNVVVTDMYATARIEAELTAQPRHLLAIQ
jgi:aspartyl-tRNA(Asn)/glutamyl-tRNA(Gln) amidotransferase subunit A